MVRAFYEFWIARLDGLLINPVQLDRRGRRPTPITTPSSRSAQKAGFATTGRSPNGDHGRFPITGGAIYRGLRSNRDRALLALADSRAARWPPSRPTALKRSSAYAERTWTGVISIIANLRDRIQETKLNG